MFAYMVIYLGIINYAIKDAETVSIIIVYALSCGIGNLIRMKLEKHG